MESFAAGNTDTDWQRDDVDREETNNGEGKRLEGRGLPDKVHTI